MSILLQLAYRELIQNLRKLWPTIVTLVLAIAAIVVVKGGVALVTSHYELAGREILGGDLVVSAGAPITVTQSPTLTALQQAGAKFNTVIQANSVLRTSKNTETAFASVKVISATYPLVGTLALGSGASYTPLAATDILVEPALLGRLHLAVGDQILLGKATFTIRDTIAHEPDSTISPFALGLRVMVSSAGWELAALDRTGSRIDYQVRVVAPAATLLDPELTTRIRADFPAVRVTVRTPADGPASLMRILRIAERFFLTVTITTLALAVISMYVSVSRYLATRLRLIALFRTLGMQRWQTLVFFLVLTGSLGLVSGVAGVMLGNLLTWLGTPYLAMLLSITPVPTFAPTFVLGGLLVGLGTSIVANGVLFLTLLQIRPVAILRARMDTGVMVWPIRLLVLSLLMLLGGLLLFFVIQNVRTVLYLTAGLAGSTVVLLVLLSYLTRWLSHFQKKAQPFLLRSIFSYFVAPGNQTSLIQAGLALAITAIATILLLQVNLLDTIKNYAARDAPSLVLFDVQPTEYDAVQEITQPYGVLLPIIRGKIMMIDDKTLDSAEDLPRRGGRREFSLTYRDELLATEKIVSGAWWRAGTTAAEVSVESDTAADFGIRLGSRITFDIHGVPVRATVTSIREVTSRTSGPWFVFVTSPIVLREAPRTYFSLLQVPATEKIALQNKLAHTFPAISIADTSDLAKTITTIAEQVSGAIALLTAFTMVSSIVVLLAIIQSAFAGQSRDLLRLRIIGASRRYLWLRYLLEIVIYLAITITPAFTLAVGSVWILKKFVFEFQTALVGSWSLVLIPLLYLLIGVLTSALLLRGKLQERLAIRSGEV